MTGVKIIVMGHNLAKISAKTLHKICYLTLQLWICFTSQQNIDY